MKKLLLALVLMGPLAAEENEGANIAKISEAFGHLLGKNLDSMGMKFDIAKVIKGLEDASEGKAAPMTEMECVQAISAVQENIYKETAAENLKEAEEFLAHNKIEEGVHSLEEGKLQYKITHEGNGEAVDQNSSPLIKYVGKFLSGAIFGESKEEEIVLIDETLPAFSKGIIGMKTGEKRTLYIHPELGYGTEGDLPPNSLLMFDVEIVQANAPHTEALDALTPSHKSRGNPEIASPFEEPRVIR